MNALEDGPVVVIQKWVLLWTLEKTIVPKGLNTVIGLPSGVLFVEFVG